MPKIVAQDDVIIRTAQVILDPNTDPERYAAFADYYHVDIPEFDDWVARVRGSVPDLFPAELEIGNGDGLGSITGNPGRRGRCHLRKPDYWRSGTGRGAKAENHPKLRNRHAQYRPPGLCGARRKAPYASQAGEYRRGGARLRHDAGNGQEIAAAGRAYRRSQPARSRFSGAHARPASCCRRKLGTGRWSRDDLRSDGRVPGTGGNRPRGRSAGARVWRASSLLPAHPDAERHGKFAGGDQLQLRRPAGAIRLCEHSSTE